MSSRYDRSTGRKRQVAIPHKSGSCLVQDFLIGFCFSHLIRRAVAMTGAGGSSGLVFISYNHALIQAQLTLFKPSWSVRDPGMAGHR